MLNANSIRKIMGNQIKSETPKPKPKAKSKVIVSNDIVNLVLSYISADTAICREDLVKATQLHPCTVSRATSSLLKSERIKKDCSGGIGRKAYFILSEKKQ